MAGYYERRWSSAAVWCERIAAISIPFFGIAILLHRMGEITTPQVVWLGAAGLALLLVSLFLGIRALVDLWTKGLRGGKATVRGVIISLLLLTPFVWHGYLAVEHPMLSDVSTNPYNPPPFIEVARERAALAGEGANPFADYDAAYADILIAEYPKVGSRRYNAGPERVLASVSQLVADRGWKVIATRGVPEDLPPPAGVPEPQAPETAAPEAKAQGGGDADANGSKAAKKGNGDKDKAAAAEEQEIASDLPGTIEIEAVASSPVFAFKNDIVIQIVSEAEATLLDMRASSRFGAHDFGYNAQLIEKFLADVDTSLLGIAGEG
jgi:hypothetical protein